VSNKQEIDLNLLEFIDSNETNLYIEEPGLSYYVRKSFIYPGVIELANCSATADKGLGYWRFLKKYEATIPFIAEQVLNKDLANLYRRRGWAERSIGGIPQFASPLMTSLFFDHKYYVMQYRTPSVDFF
jgi:hypothetical protein